MLNVVTITFGWWLLPALVGALSMVWVFWPRPEEWQSRGDYSIPDGTLFAPARAAAAVIASLLAVIVWLLVR
jgi:hypothetical protein